MATTNKKAPTKADIEKELADTKSALDEALALIKELKANPVTPQVVVQQNNPKISKIKCINLAHNPVNVATQPNAQGRVFTFKEYGQAQFIRYDDLLDIISSYPNTMKSGIIYVADKAFCDEQGLYDDSKVIYTKELMDEIVYLREDKDVDLLAGMDKALLESTLVEIARLYHAGEAMEANKLARIKNELGYDIAKMADDMKIFDGVDAKEE
jgi:hypothetical protein